MRYFNDLTLCVERAELLDLMPEGTYKSLQQRGKITVVNNTKPALVEFESLPTQYKSLIVEKYGDPYEYISKQPIRDLIKPDYEAKRFFDLYLLPDSAPLDAAKRLQYTNNASILNALKTLLSNKKALKITLQITLSQFWNKAGEVVKDVAKQYPNTLPTSEKRLKETYRDYIREGYESLIDKRTFNESNNKKVDIEIERLLLSIYVQSKCFAKETYVQYKRFMQGTELLVNENTGEVFNPLHFYKNGDPIILSETTVWRYVNAPKNRPAVDKLRLSALEFNSTHRPHMHRHAPNFSLTKITMDDISIPFKMHDGKRVWAYQVFDVLSGCVIGKAFARSNDEGSGKDRSLFISAVIDMFRTITNNNWGTPLQVEIEQHITNTFAEDLLKQGNIFPFVHFCRGGNPQEKRAEGFINAKKYSLQHQREGFIGRHYARTEAKRLNQDKNKRYSFEEIVANETADINEWNNSEHPKFPGKTRWEILTGNINPEISAPDYAMLSLFIGTRVETSVQRSQYVIVKGCKYILPDVRVLDRLNDLQVTACFIPNDDDTIPTVHIYQGGKFICTCNKIDTYNEAIAERTDADTAIMNEQFAYRKSFDTYIKTRVNEFIPVQTITNKHPETTPKSTDKTDIKTTIINIETPESGFKDWSKIAFDNL